MQASCVEIVNADPGSVFAFDPTLARISVMAKKYTVSDGKLVLELHPAEEGGFTVTAPLIPGLVTEAETIQEAFEMAHDAHASLKAARKKLGLDKRPASFRRTA